MSLSAHIKYLAVFLTIIRLDFAVNQRCDMTFFVVQLISFKPTVVHCVEKIFPFVSTVADPDCVNPDSDPDPDSEPGKNLKNEKKLF